MSVLNTAAIMWYFFSKKLKKKIKLSINFAEVTYGELIVQIERFFFGGNLFLVHYVSVFKKRKEDI